MGMERLLRFLHLPRLISYLLVGMLIGPYGLNIISVSLQESSALLRTIALIIILVRAGLSLDLSQLNTLKRPMILLSFVPALFEMIGYVMLAPFILGINYAEALLMGTVLAAVSPAVIVPRMIDLEQKGLGVDKGIPSLVLAGASLDDIAVLVVFSSALRFVKAGQFNGWDLLKIPLNIVLGIAVGVCVGWIVSIIYHKIVAHFSWPQVVLTVGTFGVAFIVYQGETYLSHWLPYSGLLAVMTLFIIMNRRLTSQTVEKLSQHYQKMWGLGEMVLFGLVGALVNIPYAMIAGPQVLLLIGLTLIFRVGAVILSLMGTPLTFKERFFVCIAYLPKATVQAAIGGIPLAEGLLSGQMILTTSIWGILLTAPLGAWSIDRLAPIFLKKRKDKMESI